MTLPWRWSAGAVVVLIAVVIAMPSTAAGHDSLAPVAAKHVWLPPEGWVFRHWIPFDRAELERALSLRAGELHAYLYNDHRTLAALARLRGIDPERLADQLVAPWRGRVDQVRIALLRERTLRILTQGHLAQHVFFHDFHGVGMKPYSLQLFGVSGQQFEALRVAGDSALVIAQEHGIAPETTRSGLEALFREDHAAGIERLQAWPSESDRILEQQLRNVVCWMSRPRPSLDPGNPFGKATRQHGAHRAGWPFTDSDRTLDELGVEWVRRRLKPSCWQRPGAWRRPAFAATASASWLATKPDLQRHMRGAGRVHRAPVCVLEI